jgi:hypothetical protein
MLRTTNTQRSLWEAILPAEALGLSTELTMVDRLLDDPVFIQPFRVHFDPILGRPSIPIETYLRLMFLKHRYGLGYELLSRTQEAKQVVFEVTGHLARLAEAQLTDARRMVTNARRALARGRIRPPIGSGCWWRSLRPRSSGASGSSTRPTLAWPVGCRMGPAGWSACTTPTPARSARAASATRSSSATRPRSWTTPTGSCSTTRSWSPTHPMRRCWPPPSGGSSPAPASHRRLVKWRTGCEGRISGLKHRFGQPKRTPAPRRA